MAVGRIIPGVLLFALFAACDAPGTRNVTADVAGFCRPSSTELAEPLDPASPRDAAVAARFGEVCELSRLNGLRFDTDAAAYECRLFLPRYDSTFFEKRGERFVQEMRETLRRDGNFDEKSFEKRVTDWQSELEHPDERLTEAFGAPLSLSDFHSAAMNADDLIEAEYASGKGEVGLGLPLAIMAFFGGADISIVLLSEDGISFDYIWSREDLKERLREVDSLEGAANLLYLTEAVGMVEAAPDKRASPLCKATGALADAQGWNFKGVEKKRNCWPSVYRNIRIARNGEIESEAGREPFSLMKTTEINCYD